MAKEGIITRKEIIEDDALIWGTEYKKNVKIAIDANKKLKQSALEMFDIYKNHNKIKNNQDFLNAKQQEALALKKATNAIKEQEVAEISAEKIKREHLKTAKRLEDQTKRNSVAWKTQQQAESSLIATKQKNILATESTNRALIKQQEELRQTNKEIRLQTRIQVGLADAYEKLNIKRTKAQRTLANLLSAEKRNVKQIRIAQGEYNKLDKRIKAVDNATKNFSKNIGNYRSAIGGLTGTLRGLVSALGLVGGAFAFVSVIRNSINIIRDFGATMSNVAGIYRVSRKDLADLEDEIISVAGASVKTATEVAKLAESLATLGKSKDEIVQLLEPVNNLSIGLKATSEETAEFLVQTINAFGGSSSEAEKYADVIATIRTSTSLDFQKMRDSFQYLTPISRILNKDLSYTGALIGLLADNGVKAERAGRLLGTAQQKLAKEGKTLAGALEEVNDASRRGVKEEKLLAIASNLFGKQAASLGIILAQNSKEIDINADAIRNNGGALDDLVKEQLSSLDAHLLILKSRWEEYILNTDKSTGASKVLKDAIKFLSDNLGKIIDVIITVTGLFLLYKTAVIAVGLAKKIATTFTIAYKTAVVAMNKGLINSIKSMKLLRVALIKTGIGAVVIAVVALVVALKSMNKELSTSRKKQKLLNNAHKTAAKSIAKEELELSILVKTAQNDNLSKKQRLEAIKKLNEINPEYLGNITLENIKTADTTKAIDLYLKALYKKALVEELINKRTKLKIELIEVENSSLKDNVSGWERFGNALISLGTPFLAMERNRKTGIKNRKKDIDSIKQQTGALDDLLKKQIEQSLTPPPAPAPSGGDDFPDQEIEAAKAKAKLDLKIKKDAFELAKFRIEQGIKLNNELSKNEEENAIERFDAIEKRTEAEKKLIDEQFKYNLSVLGEFSEEKAKFVREFTDEEIQELIAGNSIKKELTNEQLLILEKYYAKKKEIEENNKSDIETLVKFDSLEKKINEEINAEKKALLESLNAVEITEKKKRELIENSERKIAEIRRKYAIEYLEDQLKNLKELLSQAGQGHELRVKYEAQIQKLTAQILDLKLEKHSATEDEITEKVKSSTKEILEISQDLTNALAGLGNALFEGKIQKIDEEIQKNEEHYARQLELAGDDEIKKQLIQDEAEKKRQALEKKKRKEQQKQAKLNKAMAATDVGFNTALAIISALAQIPKGDGGFFASATAITYAAIGAVQLAAVLAKPIPKYAKGTENHPGGYAEVAENRPEVIETPNSKPYLVRNRSILNLPKKTKVHSSLENYKAVKRAAIMASFEEQNNRLKDYQTDRLFDSYNKDIIKELQLTREALKKQTIHFHERKIDVEHAVWRQNNIDW